MGSDYRDGRDYSTDFYRPPVDDDFGILLANDPRSVNSSGGIQTTPQQFPCKIASELPHPRTTQAGQSYPQGGAGVRDGMYSREQFSGHPLLQVDRAPCQHATHGIRIEIIIAVMMLMLLILEAVRIGIALSSMSIIARPVVLDGR